MKASTALLAMLLFAAVLASSYASETVDLGSEQILALVDGKSIDAKHTDYLGTFKLDFREGGTLYGWVDKRNDNGTWSVRDGLLCIKWRKWTYDGCGKVQRTSPTQIQHLWPDGRVHFTVPG